MIAGTARSMMTDSEDSTDGVVDEDTATTRSFTPRAVERENVARRRLRVPTLGWREEAQLRARDGEPRTVTRGWRIMLVSTCVSPL